MLLSKATLGLAKLAPKEKSRNYSLQGICIERDRATVTDGTKLVSVTHGNQPLDKNFPQTDGLEHKTFSVGPMEERVMLSRDAALSALKALPKRSKIPVLQMAALSTDATLFVNTLDRVQTFKGEMKGTFPNWRTVVPTGEVAAEVVLDARQLKAIAEYYIEHSEFGGNGRPMRLTIYKSKYAPVRFDVRTHDGKEIMALLQPTQLESSQYPKRPDQVEAETQRDTAVPVKVEAS
jgi:hypothetical protein